MTETFGRVHVLLMEGLAVEEGGEAGELLVDAVDVVEEAAEARLQRLILEQIVGVLLDELEAAPHVLGRLLGVAQLLRERIHAGVLAVRVVREHLGGERRGRGFGDVAVGRHAEVAQSDRACQVERAHQPGDDHRE